jgi:hypothetical protein
VIARPAFTLRLRARGSTVALTVAFLAVLAVYLLVRPAPKPAVRQTIIGVLTSPAPSSSAPQRITTSSPARRASSTATQTTPRSTSASTPTPAGSLSPTPSATPSPTPSSVGSPSPSPSPSVSASPSGGQPDSASS